MPNTNDLARSSKWQILLFAPSKAGKTFGALTFPRPNVMDFDKGIATVLNPEFVKKYGKLSIEYEQFSERNLSKGVAVTHNAFDDACMYFDRWMKPDKRDQFDTWVIDSGTTLADLAMNKAMIVLGSQNLSKTHEAAIRTGVLTPKQQDWGSERSLTEQFIDMVKGSGKHVILICHQKEKMNDKGDTVVEICPLLTGKGVEAISLKFDEIYYLKVKGNPPDQKRVLYTQQTGLIKCGSRLGIPHETEWSYPALEQALNQIRAATPVAKDTTSSTSAASPK